MIRLVWLIVLAIVALCATGAQLDRASRRQPAVAMLVPPPFRSFAQERLAVATVRSDLPDTALQTAQTLVRRRPIPSENLSLLAIAAERNGEREKSSLLVQYAARRGWRDSIAQQAMFHIALEAGDPAEAARRLAALWAVREDQVPLGDLTSRLLSTEQGRAAMASTLRTSGRWERAFLSSATNNPSHELALTIALAARGGARLDCESIDRLSRFYRMRKAAADAQIVDQAVPSCIKER